MTPIIFKMPFRKDKSYYRVDEPIREAIDLGFQGDANFRKIVFDFAPWRDKYGPGTISLWYEPNGSADIDHFAPELSIEGTTATWTVSEMATLKSGPGEAQLTYTTPDGIIAKSLVFKTHVERSLGNNPAPVYRNDTPDTEPFPDE